MESLYSLPDDPENPKATCNHYNKDYTCHPHRNGTTSMSVHLETQCTNMFDRKEDKNQKILSFQEKEMVKVVRITC